MCDYMFLSAKMHLYLCLCLGHDPDHACAVLGWVSLRLAWDPLSCATYLVTHWSKAYKQILVHISNLAACGFVLCGCGASTCLLRKVKKLRDLLLFFNFQPYIWKVSVKLRFFWLICCVTKTKSLEYSLNAWYKGFNVTKHDSVRFYYTCLRIFDRTQNTNNYVIYHKTSKLTLVVSDYILLPSKYLFHRTIALICSWPWEPHAQLKRLLCSVEIMKTQCWENKIMQTKWCKIPENEQRFTTSLCSTNEPAYTESPSFFFLN